LSFFVATIYLTPLPFLHTFAPIALRWPPSSLRYARTRRRDMVEILSIVHHSRRRYRQPTGRPVEANGDASGLRFFPPTRRNAP